MASFAVKFLGCKVSQADAMLARRALLAAGHTEAAEDEADLHVINTCCITSEAEAKSRQSVRRSLKTADQVLVSGCAVNLNALQFAEIDERVKAFVGTAEAVAGDMAHSLGACADLEHDVLARESPAGTAAGAAAQAARTRGFVKIQDGCDCHCAYCIIPTVRGEARSRPAGAVLEEARLRVDQGQPEMVMTGISVGDYRDPERGLELGELMVAVAQVPGVERVRLSSVEVIHVKDSLLHALATEPKVCPHLHVPMQSGDDEVLGAMGRHYTAGEYQGIVAALRKAVPHVNLTTDVIVGFPTETERRVPADPGCRRRRGHQPRPHVLVLPAPGHGSRAARRPRPARGEEAPLARAARALGGPLAPPSRRQARRPRAGADRQGGRHPVLGLHRRLHPLLPPRGRRRAG